MAIPLTLVINLDESHQRLERISARLSQLNMPFERVPAVYGASLSAAQREEFYSHRLNAKSYRRQLSSAEIGCYMSHLKAWQAIVDRELPCALVIEDDLIIDDELNVFIQKLSRSTTDWDIVKFYCRKSNPVITSRMPIGRNHDLCRFHKIPIGNLALTSADLYLKSNAPCSLDSNLTIWYLPVCLMKYLELFQTSPLLRSFSQ